MANTQPAIRFGSTNNPQSYNAYDYYSTQNPNPTATIGRVANYQATSSAYAANPPTKVTFNHGGSSVAVSPAVKSENTSYIVPPSQPQVVAINPANPPTVAIQRNEVIVQRPADRNSTVQKAGPPSVSSTAYVPPTTKPTENKCPKWLWALVGVLALAALVLGLLWALGVFGGKNNSTTTPSAGAATTNTSAQVAAGTQAGATTPSTTSTTTSSTTSTAGSSSTPTGTTTVSPSGTATATSGVVPMGIPPQEIKTNAATSSTATAQPATAATTSQPATGTTATASANSIPATNVPTTTLTSSTTTPQPASTGATSQPASTSSTTTTTTTKTN